MKDYTIITLKNEFLEVEILDYGATLISMKRLGGNNIVVAYQNIDDYFGENGAFLGATVGPIAGRTALGKLNIHGNAYQLSRNNGINHLHGGETSCAKHRFNYSQDNLSARFSASIDHRPDGYPGWVHYEVVYRLDQDSLVIDLKAYGDHDLPLNITNHAYFNLNTSNTLTGQRFKVASKQVQAQDASNANIAEIIESHNTVFDLNEGQEFSELLKQSHPQFEYSRFYDHDFYLDGNVELESQDQRLTVATSAPIMRVYSANFFDEGFIANHGEKAKSYTAIALEPQNLANGYNLYPSDDLLYNEDKPFQSTMRYTLRSLHGTDY